VLELTLETNRRTALHFAFLYLSEQSVKILLEYGSEINIMCKKGRVALDLIFLIGTDDILEAELISTNIYDFEPMQIKNTMDIFHIIKMKAANLYVCQRNGLYYEKMSFVRRYMDFNGYIDFYYDEGDFRDRCETELASMKRKKIVNSTLSFYDILAKGESSLTAYMRNENVVEV
jgi:hypothetical protein